MKKYILLILTIFLLSGCSVEYNLDFQEKEIKENIKIGEFISSNIPDYEYIEFKSLNTLKYDDYYNTNYQDNYLNLNYNYSNLDKFKVSEVFTKCFELSNISEDDNYYYILTSGEFKCLSYSGYNTSEVKINFTSDYIIEETNSDYEKKDTHTWVINKANYKNKPIEIKLSKNLQSKDSFFDKYGRWIICALLLVLALLLRKYIKWKQKTEDI